MHRTRRLPWAVNVAALLVLAVTIVLAVLYVRTEIRRQIVSRDGVALYEVSLMHAKALAEGLEELGSMHDPANQSFVLLQTSRLRGVIATRLFDREGRFQETFPENVLEARLPTEDLTAMHTMQPVCRYHAAMPLSDLFYPAEGEIPERGPGQPVLEINIPLHPPEHTELVGVGQFLIQGNSIASEFARLDRSLMALSGITFLTGGGLLTLFMQIAFRRLRRTQELLSERTRTLSRANRELALAAKTSAVGSIASHLIHGLKNPLSGLQSLMKSMEHGEGGLEKEDRQRMMSATRRMQAMITDVVGVLREQESGHQYELTVAELLEIVETRIRPLAEEARVTYESRRTVEGTMSNREAGLVTLILINLLQNAIQATPSGKSVSLRVESTESGWICLVEDEGAGFPEDLKPAMFTPCPSSREGGSGIGLAISKQLSDHLGARLELHSSSKTGCVFALVLPHSLFLGHSTVAGADQVR